MDFNFLRGKYQKFIYESYSYKVSGNSLEIFFNFEIDPEIEFRPQVTIENIDKESFKKVGESQLKNLIFNLGLIEMISYWKVVCSKTIEVKAGFLDQDQINWLKDLILNGMGQYFYENKIDFRGEGFLEIISWQKGNHEIFEGKLKDRYLVPIGGGKDSVVTLESLKGENKEIRCFGLNPTDASLKIMKIAKCSKSIIVKRTIDNNLLKLNRQGFLNGHTPFSAYLAFLTTLCAVIFDYKYIALSNEKSSNEGNVEYLGKIINHQWSKTEEFENKFRDYSKKYLARDVEYFSYLRKYYEIQIAKLFAKNKKYFKVFLSCNEAYKTLSGAKKPMKKWCCECSKCLFAFAILYPFLTEKEIIKIFGKNLFENKNLLPIMQELIGERNFKPFECVGTIKESLVAFYLSFKKQKSKQLPVLMEYFKNYILPKNNNIEKEVKEFMD